MSDEESNEIPVNFNLTLPRAILEAEFGRKNMILRSFGYDAQSKPTIRTFFHLETQQKSSNPAGCQGRM